MRAGRLCSALVGVGIFAPSAGALSQATIFADDGASVSPQIGFDESQVMPPLAQPGASPQAGAAPLESARSNRKAAPPQVESPPPDEPWAFIAAVSKAIVSVRRGQQFATGLVIGPAGRVVTSLSAVDGPGRVRVRTADGLSVNARVVAVDRAQDIALLEPTRDLAREWFALVEKIDLAAIDGITNSKIKALMNASREKASAKLARIANELAPA